MKEYIEREKAFDAVFVQFCASSDETEAALNAAIEEISAIPAADVRPVVRGKWEEVDRTPIFEWMEEHSTYRCSSCRAYQFYDVFDNGTARYNFCPNCGADMREES